MKKLISILLVLLVLTSCKSYEVSNKSFDSSKEIVILYCNNKNANLKDIKNNEINNTPNVTFVSTGNITDIDLMNNFGLDYSCFGLKDFDKGLDSLYKNTCQAKYKYLLCSASYNGQIKDYFKKTAPYEIVNYDGIKVAYIGVLSPRYVETNPNYFIEGDNIVVNFYNETEEVFYDTVECSIEKAIDKGADYIVIISNFDDDEKYSPYSLKDLISNLSYVDVVINGNDYSNLKEAVLKNKDNRDVIVVSNGIHVGKITIKDNSIQNNSLD